MRIEKYQDTGRVERPKISSVINKDTLKYESYMKVEKRIRNGIDERAVRKESVEVKRHGIIRAADEQASDRQPK